MWTSDGELISDFGGQILCTKASLGTENNLSSLP
jgi:hypothetical protein